MPPRISDFFHDVQASGLFAAEELPRMRAMARRMHRTTTNLRYNDEIIDRTIAVIEPYFDLIHRNFPDLEAYLLERVGSAMLAQREAKLKHAPHLAREERQRTDHKATESEISSALSGLSGLSDIAARPMAPA